MAIGNPVRHCERGGGGADPPGRVVQTVVVGLGEGVEMLHASAGQPHRGTLAPAPQKRPFVLTAKFPYQTEKEKVIGET